MIYLMYAVIGFAVVWGLQYVLFVYTLLGCRLKKGNIEPQETDRLPEYLNDVFRTCREQLEALGFVFSHTQIEDNIVVSSYCRKWQLVYFHEEEKTYATLSISTVPRLAEQHTVEFLTIFSDGHSLLTVNGTSCDILDRPPNTTLVDPFAETLEKQWQAHLQVLNDLRDKKTAVALSIPDFLECQKLKMDEYIDQLETDGRIYRCGENLYRLSLGACVQLAFQFKRSRGRVRQMQSRMRQLPCVQNQALAGSCVQIEVERFHQMSNMSSAPKMNWLGKLVVLVVSMVLFALALGMKFSVEFVALLVVAVFIHEMGHLAGMRLFKYRDVKVLFLPFLGAATIGTAQNVKVWQKVIVYMLGPGPGILIGSACLVGYEMSHVPFLKDACILFLGLNIMNLLPIMPFDGGQLFNLLFQRFTTLQSAFFISSALLLAVGGICLNEPIFFFISVFLCVAIPTQIRSNQALNRLKQRMKGRFLQADLDEDIVLQEIFAVLSEKPFAKIPYSRKYHMARYMLDNAGGDYATAGTITLSLLFYLMLWLCPLVIMLFVVTVQSLVNVVRR